MGKAFDRVELQERVIAALCAFYESDADLISAEDMEWAKSIRIAMHLRDQMRDYEAEGYRVDGEYNRCGPDPKRRQEEEEKKLFRPDIILHKRALKERSSIEDNVLYCELKVNGLSNTDVSKIKEMVQVSGNYQYQYGLGIDNIKAKGIDLTWYVPQNKNGEIVPISQPYEVIRSESKKVTLRLRKAAPSAP